jgi:hypothetical protein
MSRRSTATKAPSLSRLPATDTSGLEFARAAKAGERTFGDGGGRDVALTRFFERC